MTGLFVLCGLAVGTGVWLIGSGMRRTHRPNRRDRANRPKTGTTLWEKLTGGTGRRLAAAVAVSVVVAAVTRWPAAVVLAALFTYAAPALLGGGRAQASSLAKLEAIASWTETLRGSLRSYAGIEQAIKDTAELAKPPIHAQTVALAAALAAGVRLTDALTSFKADVDHHAADLVATALRKAAATHTGNLAGQLGWLAHAVRERVAAMQRVETARTEAKTSATLVLAIVVVVGCGLYVFNRPLLAPYATPAGQVVLLLVGALWTLAAGWLHRLTQVPEPARGVLKDDPERSRP